MMKKRIPAIELSNRFFLLVAVLCCSLAGLEVAQSAEILEKGVSFTLPAASSNPLSNQNYPDWCVQGPFQYGQYEKAVESFAERAYVPEIDVVAVLYNYENTHRNIDARDPSKLKPFGTLNQAFEWVNSTDWAANSEKRLGMLPTSPKVHIDHIKTYSGTPRKKVLLQFDFGTDLRYYNWYRDKYPGSQVYYRDSIINAAKAIASQLSAGDYFAIVEINLRSIMYWKDAQGNDRLYLLPGPKYLKTNWWVMMDMIYPEIAKFCEHRGVKVFPYFQYEDLFGNRVPSDLLHQYTTLSATQIQRLVNRRATAAITDPTWGIGLVTEFFQHISFRYRIGGLRNADHADFVAISTYPSNIDVLAANSPENYMGSTAQNNYYLPIASQAERWGKNLFVSEFGIPFSSVVPGCQTLHLERMHTLLKDSLEGSGRNVQVMNWQALYDAPAENPELATVGACDCYASNALGQYNYSLLSLPPRTAYIRFLNDFRP